VANAVFKKIYQFCLSRSRISATRIVSCEKFSCYNPVRPGKWNGGFHYDSPIIQQPIIAGAVGSTLKGTTEQAAASLQLADFLDIIK